MRFIGILWLQKEKQKTKKKKQSGIEFTYLNQYKSISTWNSFVYFWLIVCNNVEIDESNVCAM